MDLIDLDAAWSSEWLSDQQKADPDIGRLHEMLATKNPRPARDEDTAMSPELKTYVTVWDSLVMVNDVIYRKFERPEGDVLFYQLLAPRTL